MDGYDRSTCDITPAAARIIALGFHENDIRFFYILVKEQFQEKADGIFGKIADVLEALNGPDVRIDKKTIDALKAELAGARTGDTASEPESLFNQCYDFIAKGGLGDQPDSYPSGLEMLGRAFNPFNPNPFRPRAQVAQGREGESSPISPPFRLRFG